MLTTVLSLLLCASVGVYYLLSRLKSSSQPDGICEPSVISPWPPVIGHILGMMNKKYDYYVELSRRCSLPIFTISMLGSKMYIVTSTNLIQAVQKQSKTLAFPPIEAHFANKMCGTSDVANAIVNKAAEGEEGLTHDLYAAMRDILKPGPVLDVMNRSMATKVCEHVDNVQSLLSNGPNPLYDQKFNMSLLTWVQGTVTLATTHSVYGENNPLYDQSIRESFWEFERGLVGLLFTPLPSVFARKALHARERVVKALDRYMNAYQENASELVKARNAISNKYCISLSDVARYELGNSFATLVNTAPAAFWMIYLTYSTPGLLDQIRAEIDAVTIVNGSDRLLDLASLKENCPLMTSTYREMLRFRSVGTSVRKVMEDTVLDGKWLLKKGCLVQMPSRVLHTNPNLWGADVNDFNPRRFMKENAASRRSEASFRAFGGGKTLCLGRHFATNEVLIFTALFVTRFDLAPTSGHWRMPSTKSTNMAAVIATPDDDPEVEITLRRGYGDAKWSVSMSASAKTFAMVVEDQI